MRCMNSPIKQSLRPQETKETSYVKKSNAMIPVDPLIKSSSAPGIPVDLATKRRSGSGIRLDL